MKTIIGIIALLALTGCSVDVAGTVSYATKGGDTKRLSELTVVIVDASPETEKVLTEAFAPLTESVDRSLKAALAAAKSGDDSAMNKASEDHGRFLAENEAHLKKLAAWSIRGQAMTDVNGNFRISGVKAGRYKLIANFHGANDNLLEWAVPIEVGRFSGDVRQDLTGANSSPHAAIVNYTTSVARNGAK